MKTSVGSTKAGGRASVQPLQQSGEIMIAVTSPTGTISGAALDMHSAYVLGAALVKLAEQAERAQNVTLPKAYEVTEVHVNGVRCHGDLCAAVQISCPSHKACGVAA